MCCGGAFATTNHDANTDAPAAVSTSAQIYVLLFQPGELDDSELISELEASIEDERQDDWWMPMSSPLFAAGARPSSSSVLTSRALAKRATTPA